MACQRDSLSAAGRRRLLDRLVTLHCLLGSEHERAAGELDVFGGRTILQEALGVLQVTGVAELHGYHALVELLPLLPTSNERLTSLVSPMLRSNSWLPPAPLL